MRALLLIGSMLWLAGPAIAGDVSDRLDRIEYDGRIQRADSDMLARQQALDAQDARDRSARSQTEDMLRDLQRGPGIAPPKPSGYLYR